MVKSIPNSHLHHQDEPEGYDSSSYRGEVTKVDGSKSSGEQKPNNTLRSKHSETEQRRRSKINHRFQILRDLIPQNDQKRDKASFLLEVIEYIQFLLEKLQMYEGPCQAWTREPSKLMPWKNHQAPAESIADHSQIMKNGSVHETSEMLTNVQNVMECELDATVVYKTLEHLPGSMSAMTLNVPNQSNMCTATGRAATPAESFQESVADAENMAYQLQSQLWQVRPCATECAAPNNAEKRHAELTNETGSSNVSGAYSQGVLNILTESLQSAGVDLSQTRISVQIDVKKHGNGGADNGTWCSKDERKRYAGNQEMEEDGDVEECDKTYNTMRSESS